MMGAQKRKGPSYPRRLPAPRQMEFMWDGDLKVREEGRGWAGFV